MASVKVAVRVRPFNQRERDMNSKLIIQMDGRKTRIHSAKTPKESLNGGSGDHTPRDRYKDFTFDYSYWSFDKDANHYASQDEVFHDLGVDVVSSAFEGYNACVFAYGQTGSGKTYTMMGSGEEPGLIPRICQALFARMHTGKEQGASYRTEVSYLEIYNERVKDLLGGSSSASHNLRVREHPRHGPYVQDLSKHLVSDYLDVQELMARGNAQRTTAATNMNDVSSRSHAIFTLMFVQAGLSSDNLPTETVSKVHLVDLAGSERADASGATGQRLKEGAHINKSLVTLGSVISALAEASSVANSTGSGDALSPRGAKTFFIPYRDSVLTWLLKDSLGGNSKTIMIAAVSPADVNYGETLSTLRYANRAKNIINKPTINEDPNVRLIRDLREEIAKLKSLLGSEYPEQPDMLARLHQKEAQEKVLTEKWAEKWRETQKILQEQQALGLRKAGPGVVLDSDMPHLIGIDDDLLSTGVTLYHLKEGPTTIGSEEDNDSEVKPDIILNGLGLERRHCTIRLENGVATLEPELQAQCLVNSVLIDKPTRLSQGCIILLGGTNMFRYNDPVEAAKLRKESTGKSQLNLSRLSMLSFSTQDLAYSTENLVLSEDIERSDDLEQQKANFEKEKESFRREQMEREQDWEKLQNQKRDALHAAQKELEEEKEQMAMSYAAQCRQLAEDWRRLEKHQTEQLTALRIREEELKRRMELLEKNKHEHLSQVEIFFRQVTSIQECMNNKRRQFIEFFTSHPISPRINGTTIPSLQDLAATQLWHQNGDTPPTLSSESSPTQSSTESWASTSQDASVHGAHYETIREIVASHRKEMSCLEAELKSRTQALSEQRDRLQQLDSELKNVQFSLQEGTAEFDSMKQALALRTQKQLEEIAQRKQAMSLNLKPNTIDSASSADEMSTTSEPNQKNTPIPKEENLNVSNSMSSFSSVTPASPSLYHTPCSPPVKPPVDSDDFSSTEDPPSQASVKRSSSPFEHLPPTLHNLRLRKSRNSKSNAFTNRRSLGSGGPTSPALASGEALRAMKILCQRVTQQKMLIMQSLENDDCDKTELDQQIAELQELQRQYVQLEIALDSATNRRIPLLGSSEDSDNKSTSADDGENISSPTGSTTICNSISSRNEDSLSRISVNISPTLSPSHDILVLESSSRWVQIPEFLLRGAGSSAHFEYVIRINVDGGETRWNLLRRYKRFRELHRAMREKYGHPVGSLSFPPRVFFTKSPESLAQYRRHHLESYLRQLLDTCSSLPKSPLYSCRHRITRQALLEFSPFFKKGFFESGKYGTS